MAHNHANGNGLEIGTNSRRKTQLRTYNLIQLQKIYLKRTFWLPISISSQILDLFSLLYLSKESTEKEVQCFLYLSESSESSDYSCDFCQHKS